jgi:DNA-binding IclR family transcriptional regulator
LALLMAVGASGSTLTELAESAGVALPTAHRLVATLEDEEFVRRTGNGRIVLGRSAVRLAHEVDGLGYVTWLVRRAVAALRDKCDETAAFYIRDDTTYECVECADAQQLVRLVVALHTPVPIYLGSAGKVLMAYASKPETVLAKVPSENGYYQLPTGEKRRIATLRKELDEVRQTGVATSVAEGGRDVWGVAAPVFSGALLVGALSVAVPMSRHSDARMVELRDLVQATAIDLSLGAAGSDTEAP